MDLLMVPITARLMADPVAACAVYHTIGARVIRRVSVTAFTSVARAGLTWLVVIVGVVGWMFGGVGCHATSKGTELSYDLDYIILFWLWILSAFRGNIHVLWILSAFRGNIHVPWILSAFHGYIRISWILSALATSGSN